MEGASFINFGLSLILLLALFLPFLLKRVEENLEIFLFALGLLAVTLSRQWSWSLVREAAVEPIKITSAVLIAGLLFWLFRPAARKAVGSAVSALGIKGFSLVLVVVLGLLSSLITAIIAALLLVEVIDCMKLDRRDEIQIVVVACFAIGMGAVLTPLGEPLATIVIGKLRGRPYEATFWFLFAQFWRFVVPGVVGFGVLAAIIVRNGSGAEGLSENREEKIGDILLRTVKTYFFVMALVFLGTGFKPIVDTYISKLPAAGLFWLNSISAILDNATLAAAEVGPSMSRAQLAGSLLGLIIAGGMLIPGNIPNIIAAGKLRIKSKEWAAVGIPVGVVSMALCFAFLLVFGD